MDWRVEHTMIGTLCAEHVADVEQRCEACGAWLSIQPPDRWTVTFDVTADSAVAALTAATPGPMPADPVAVSVMTWEEVHREAERAALPALLGTSEVAGALGVSRQRVHQLATKDPTFPAPLVRVKRGPLWDARAINAWVAHLDRTPGRPATIAS